MKPHIPQRIRFIRARLSDYALALAAICLAASVLWMVAAWMLNLNPALPALIFTAALVLAALSAILNPPLQPKK